MQLALRVGIVLRQQNSVSLGCGSSCTQVPAMRDTKWLRRVLGGIVWVAVYNSIWGIAGLGFMRREWTMAAAASGQSMPWTAEFLMVWVPLTLVFGIAIAAYLDSAPRRGSTLRLAVAASLALWVPATIGMAFWATFSIRVIVLDSTVNLLAVFLASLATGRTLVVFRRPSMSHESRRHDAEV